MLKVYLFLSYIVLAKILCAQQAPDTGIVSYKSYLKAQAKEINFSDAQAKPNVAGIKLIKTDLQALPAVAYNNSNNLMLGAAFFNNWANQKQHFNYVVAPLLAFSAQALNGYGTLRYLSTVNHHLLHHINIGLSAASFSSDYYLYLQNTNYFRDYQSYYKFAPYIELKLNSPTEVDRFVDFRYLFLFLNKPKINQSQENTQVLEVQFASYYRLEKNPFAWRFNIKTARSFVNFQLEYKQVFKYQKSKKGISFRLFAGLFKNFNSNYPGYANLLSAGRNGYSDYLYDGVLAAREDQGNLLSRQFVESEANLKVNTPLGNTESWMTAANLKFPFGPLPLGIFTDLCLVASEKSVVTNSAFLYDAGLCLGWGKIFNIYLPLIVSEDIKDVEILNNNGNKLSPWQRLRFSLQLPLLSPFKANILNESW